MSQQFKHLSFLSKCTPHLPQVGLQPTLQLCLVLLIKKSALQSLVNEVHKVLTLLVLAKVLSAAFILVEVSSQVKRHC
jgi:cobalamin synthase